MAYLDSHGHSELAFVPRAAPDWWPSLTSCKVLLPLPHSLLLHSLPVQVLLAFPWGFGVWFSTFSSPWDSFSVSFPLSLFFFFFCMVLSFPLGYQVVSRVANTGSGFRMPGSLAAHWPQDNYLHGLSRFQLPYLQNGHISDNIIQWH